MAERTIAARPIQAPVKRSANNRLFRSTVGQQSLLAVTSLALILFVLIHMAGNLLIFDSRDTLNSYAYSLEERPGLLWSARILLLLVFIIHIGIGTRLTVQSRAARPIRYRCFKPAQSSWAAQHMFLTGMLVFAFVVYHLLHFTFGVVDSPHFKNTLRTDPHGRSDVAAMVVGGFSQTPVALTYIIAQLVLGLHLAHGAWSLFQHLGLNHESPLYLPSDREKAKTWLQLLWPHPPGVAWLVRWFGVLVTSLIVLGNCSIPLAIQLGWRPDGLDSQRLTPHRQRESETTAMNRRTFYIDPLPPFRLDLTVWTLRRRPDNAVDRWDGETYRRLIPLSLGLVEVAVTQVGPPNSPRLHVAIEGQSLRRPVQTAVSSSLERLLGLSTDLTSFYRLAAHDRRLRPLVERFRGMKPPRFATVFECVINAIACQQMTLTLGIRLLNDLAATYGPAFPKGDVTIHAFPRPVDLAGLHPDDLRRMGFSRLKGRAMIELSRSIAEEHFNLEDLAELSDGEAVGRLRSLRGVGRWTAEYILLRGLGRTHVFPGDDVGARNNLQHWLHVDRKLDYEGVHRVLARWNGYAGLVYFHLLLDRLEESGCLDRNGAREGK